MPLWNGIFRMNMHRKRSYRWHRDCPCFEYANKFLF